MSLLTVLWGLCQGCPNEPGPTCAEELHNAAAITNRLKKSLRDFYKSLVVRTGMDNSFLFHCLPLPQEPCILFY